jgi:hypothetical protein
MANAFQHSYATLRTLHRALLSDHDVTLPAEPGTRTESSAYLDSAIRMLGESTTKFSGKLDDVDKKVDALERNFDEKFEAVDKKLDALERNFEAVDKKLDAVDRRVDRKIEDVKNQVMALQRNSLRRVLDDPIEPISGPDKLEDGQEIYTVAEGFPQTVRDFWKLADDLPALSRLARHYRFPGWEEWKKTDSDDSDATLYDNLEDAVAAYPSKCLRILASTWGLQYSQLQRPRSPTLGGKRKADADSESSVKRLRLEENFHLESESVIFQDQDGKHFIQQRAVWQGPDIPISPRRWKQIKQLSEPESEKIIWRVGTTPSEERRRFRIRDNGRSMKSGSIAMRATNGQERTSAEVSSDS